MGRPPSDRLTVLTVGGRRAVSLGHADVLRFLALLARADVELDPLTFLEGAVAVLLDCRVVDEDVVAVFALDEAVALLGVEPLHSSCRHSSLVSRSYQLQQGSVRRPSMNALPCTTT